MEKKPASALSHGLPRSNQCCADITQSDSISRPDGPQLGHFETVFIGCRNGLSGKNPYFYVQVGRNFSSGNLFCLEFLFQFQYLMQFAKQTIPGERFCEEGHPGIGESGVREACIA